MCPTSRTVQQVPTQAQAQPPAPTLVGPLLQAPVQAQVQTEATHDAFLQAFAEFTCPPCHPLPQGIFALRRMVWLNLN